MMSHGGGGRGGGKSGRGSRGGHRSSTSRSSRTSSQMTEDRARAIQSHADRTGRNEDFKERAMSAAARNAEKDEDADEDD